MKTLFLVTAFALLSVFCLSDAASAQGYFYPPEWEIDALMVNAKESYLVTVVPTYTLVITQGGGRVTSVEWGCVDDTLPCPADKRQRINCGFPSAIGDVCQAYFIGGNPVTLRHFARSDSVFAGWLDDWFWRYRNWPIGGFGTQYWNDFVHPNNTLGNYRFYVSPYDVDNLIYAFFAPKGEKYALQMYLFGGCDAAGNKVYSTPAGINCVIGPDGWVVDEEACYGLFDAGSIVRLTSKVTNWQNKFLWWTGKQLEGPNANFVFSTCDGIGQCQVPMLFPGMTRVFGGW